MPPHIAASAKPVLFLLYLVVLFFYLPLGTPRGPVPQPDRSQPLVRDFRPLIPAHSDRRLHGRLGG